MPSNNKKYSSVRQIIQILENPRRISTLRSREPIVDRQQVKESLKAKWRDPGYCSLQFNRAPCIKPKILNEWETQRINMAVRSYKIPKGAKPYRFDTQSRGFPKVTFDQYSKKFQDHLRQVEEQCQNWRFKEKRAKTQGIQDYESTRHSQNSNRYFKPVTTSASLFGYSTMGSSTPKSSAKSYQKPRHLKTLNL